MQSLLTVVLSAYIQLCVRGKPSIDKTAGNAQSLEVIVVCRVTGVANTYRGSTAVEQHRNSGTYEAFSLADNVNVWYYGIPIFRYLSFG